jgi:hypothetical protein
MDQTIDLRPHQKIALSDLQDGSILWGRVGSGKSRVAVAYYEQEHRHKDVYVITTAKKRDSADWVGEFARIGVGPDTSDKLCTQDWTMVVPDSAHGLLVVDSWNNIGKYVDVSNAFFIFDEQRLVGSGKWVKAFLKIARGNSWIMLTATPGDTWMDYVPVFIANGFYRNRTEFIREHVVYAPFQKFPKILRYLNTGRLDQQRNRLLVRMRFQNETIRHSSIITVDHNEELVNHVIKNRWHIYQDRPIRDITELFAVMRRIINSDPDRVRKIEDYLDQHPRMVIFYNFNYELELLRKLGHRAEVAEWNGHKHEEIPTSSSWVYLVQYAAGSESWNCTETDTIMFYSLTYSYKHWEQSHGRIDRLDTPFTDLYYYILKSRSIVDTAIWRSLGAKRNFNVNTFPIESLKDRD